jgi:hypothetical protein
MDQTTVLGLAVGLGCGVCIGWALRGRLGSTSSGMAAKAAVEDLVSHKLEEKKTHYKVAMNVSTFLVYIIFFLPSF